MHRHQNKPNKAKTNTHHNKPRVVQDSLPPEKYNIVSELQNYMFTQPTFERILKRSFEKRTSMR